MIINIGKKADMALAQNSGRQNNRGADILRRLLENKVAVVCFFIFLIICLACILAPLLTPWKYSTIVVADRLQGSSLRHPLGTDNLGRDMFSRMLYGGRVTLRITLVSTALAAVIGCAIGLTAGYFGGAADGIISPVLDTLASIPIILLALIFEIAFGWGNGYFMYAMVIAAIPQFARLVRASVMNIMGREYIEAALALGVNHRNIVFRHVLHNIASPLLIRFAGGLAEALLTCTVLGYLSVGIRPPTPEWGAIAYNAKAYIRTFPYMLAIPCSFIAVCVISINIFSDGLRDAFDPKG